MPDVEIKLLTPTEVEDYRAIRLESLKQSPEAFGSTWEESVARPVEQLTGFLTTEPDRFILGAYLEDSLVGLASFHRHGGRKMAHKGEINQMYVTPAARGQGIGKLLLQNIIQRARELYLSLGFEIYGCEPRALKQDNQYFDEELMELVLMPATE